MKKIDMIRKIITKAPQEAKERIECYASVLGFDLPSDEEWQKQYQPDEHGNKPHIESYIDGKLDTAEESKLEALLKKLEGN